MAAKINTTMTTGISDERKSPLFALGAIVATPAVLEHFDKHAINAQEYIDLHVRGDWGNVSPEDAKENLLSVEEGFRILSSYDIAGERVWIITEAFPRESTCILFPQEY